MTDGRTHVLVDSGISCRRICTGLRTGRGANGARRVLITTSTATTSRFDHLTKQLQVPVYASLGPAAAVLLHRLLEGAPPCGPRGGLLPSAGWRLRPSPPLHDAAARAWATPCPPGAEGGGGHRPGLCTGAVLRGIRGGSILVAEANHDVEWVQSAPTLPPQGPHSGRPGPPVQRGGGRAGLDGGGGGARTVVLAHLSHPRTTPARPGPRGGTGVLSAGAQWPTSALRWPPQREEPEVHGMKGICANFICVGKMKEKFYIDAAAESTSSACRPTVSSRW